MTGTQHPGSLSQIEAMERHKKSGKGGFQMPDEMTSRERPNFTTELRNAEVFEGKSVHFEAKLTPQSDPNMKVEWFFNGRPLQQGTVKIHLILICDFLMCSQT